jgi:hypothetical protein
MPGLDFTEISGLIGGMVALAAGIIIMFFPRILNYLIGTFMIVAGIGWIIGARPLPGAISILFGLIVLIFPKILNYLVGIYLLLLGFWWIFAVSGSLLPGIITLVFGAVVMIFPTIINYLFGIYLILAGILAIGRHYGWF